MKEDATKAFDNEKERVDQDIIRSATKRRNSGRDGSDEGDTAIEGEERRDKVRRVVRGG